MSMISVEMKVADEAWIATALLHKENPARADFSVDEILRRAIAERPAGDLRPGVEQHIRQHCVASNRASPNQYAMLTSTGRGRRRLYRDGDVRHLERLDGKTTPDRADLPEKYVPLLSWYAQWNSASRKGRYLDPLLALYGSGKHIWADEHADEYVARLREGWE